MSAKERDPELAAAVDEAVNEAAAAAAEALDENPEQLEQLRAEAERLFQEALNLYKTRFTELPSMQKLRERWRARKIADDDPIIMNMEVHAIADARSQIILQQIMNIVQAFEQMTRRYAQQVRLSVREVGDTRKTTASYAKDLANAKAGQDALRRAIEDYGRELPELLDTMAAVRKLCDTTSLRAKLELMGVGAACVAVGILLGHFIF